jgi:hypothetical protein
MARQVHIIQSFESLYQEIEDWRPTVDGLNFSSISEEDKLLLERGFEKDEVAKALKDI